MDTTPLRNAYDEFLDATALVTSPGAVSGDPPYDNRTALDPWRIDRVIGLAGGGAGLAERIRSQGDATARCLSAQDLAEAARAGRLHIEHTCTVHRADLLDVVRRARTRRSRCAATRPGGSSTRAASRRAARRGRTSTTCRTARSSAPGTRRCAPPIRWRQTRGSTSMIRFRRIPVRGPRC